MGEKSNLFVLKAYGRISSVDHIIRIIIGYYLLLY